MTRRQAEVLAWLKAFPNDELVYERGTGYVGLQRVSGRTVFALIRSMYLRQCHDTNIGKVEHYQINETGEDALREYLGTES